MNAITTKSAHANAALTVPAGFRPATSESFVGVLDGWDEQEVWIGPKIYGPNLEHGIPETVGVLAWTPTKGIVGVLNPDIYMDADDHAIDDAFERLASLLQYAALETEATSPSALIRAYRSNEDNLSTFEAPLTDTRELLLNECGEPTLSASTVAAGSRPIGVHLSVALEDFEGLGLDVLADSNLLELTGTREEVAAAADLFMKMGSALMAYLGEKQV